MFMKKDIFNFQPMKQIQGNQNERDSGVFGIVNNVVTDVPRATSFDIEKPIKCSFYLILP